MQTDDIKLRPVFIGRDATLNRDQIRTLNTLRGQAKCDSIDARDAVLRRCVHAVLSSEEVFARVSRYIAEEAPITVNVAPHVVKLMLADVKLRSTFEVNASKGEEYLRSRVTAESRVFLGLYDWTVDARGKPVGLDPSLRPKYGALNYLKVPSGVPGAIGYGRWHFVMKDCRHRCTLAQMDTFGQVGTLAVLDFASHLLAVLTDTEFAALIAVACGDVAHGEGKFYQTPYREIQIHGDVLLGEHVASLNVQRGDPEIEIAREFARVHGCALVEFDVLPAVAVPAVAAPAVAKVKKPRAKRDKVGTK